MSRPLVSVIVPAYNAEAFIGEAIRSVLAQTMTRWELILADDGSTDSSIEAAGDAAFGDPRVRVERFPHSGLPAVARNRALRMAQAKVAAFLDADDLWEPQKLAKQLRALNARRAAWSFHNVGIFGGGEDAPGGYWYPRHWSPSPRFFPRLLTGDGVPCLSLMVRRAALQQITEDDAVFCEDPELRGFEDWDLTLRLARRSQPAYLAHVLGAYREHADGLSKSAGTFDRRLAAIERQRSSGAPEDLCRIAERRVLSKRGTARLFGGEDGWRGDYARGCLPPRDARDAALAALAALPTGVAMRVYGFLLGARRRR